MTLRSGGFRLRNMPTKKCLRADNKTAIVYIHAGGRHLLFC